jgi:hypothetical protein
MAAPWADSAKGEEAAIRFVITEHKVKVKLSPCLTKHHAMKTYWGVEV